MSGSPPRSARRLSRHDNAQWESQQHNESLQIRIVPYSPPRIASAESASSSHYSHSYTSRPNVEPDQGRYAQAWESTPDGTQALTDQESWAKPGVSDSTSPLRSLPTASSSCAIATKSTPISPRTYSFNQFPGDFDHASMSSRASSPGHDHALSTSRRSKRVISINADNKTFSLHPQTATDSSPSSRAGSFGSPPISSTTPSSSWGRVSSNVFLAEDRSSSPLTNPSQANRRFSSSPIALPANDQHQQVLNSRTAPPYWNSRMGGGLRQVDQTPESKGKQPVVPIESSDDDVDSEVYMPLSDKALGSDNAQHGRFASSPQLSAKESFETRTSESGSALSERTNYKIYGESSPIRPPIREATTEPEDGIVPSSSHSSANYQLLGETSSESQSVSDLPRPPTTDSEANYVVLGGPSASCSSLGTNRSRLRSEYSRESLQVAPLRPIKKRRSSERSGLLQSRSRESLRHGSFTSLGTTLAQEATRALFAWPSSTYSASQSHPPRPQARSGSDVPYSTAPPYEWSRPLSTVMSESEDASLSPTRSASGFSAFSAGERRSSTHSRNLLRVASSLAGLDGQVAVLGGQSFPEPPAATYQQGQSWESLDGSATAAYHEEERDGLGDLHDLHHRSSRTRLAGNSTDRVLRPSGSTRSLNPFSLPAWARVYYGGGDRRFLIAQASSESIRSLYNGSLYNDPPYTNFLRPSPSAERFNATIRNPRRRPRDVAPEIDPYDAAAASTATQPIDINRSPSPCPSRMRSIARGVRKQTSSIWSPHLRRDRRASRFSMWDPPSAVWSTDNGFDWRRNQQVVLFVLGFMVPFAWMVAAFLPLPLRPQIEMTEDRNAGNLTSGPKSQRIFTTLEEARYNSARWWRNLNRGMSVFGLLLLGAAIALIVVGVEQQWRA